VTLDVAVPARVDVVVADLVLGPDGPVLALSLLPGRIGRPSASRGQAASSAAGSSVTAMRRASTSGSVEVTTNSSPVTRSRHVVSHGPMPRPLAPSCAT